MAPKWGVDLYTGSTYTQVNTVVSAHRCVQCTDCFVVYFSFSNGCEEGVGDVSSKLNGLSFAELLQCVGVRNLQYSWERALDSYSYAAHRSLPPVSSKESHKVAVDNNYYYYCVISSKQIQQAL